MAIDKNPKRKLHILTKIVLVLFCLWFVFAFWTTFSGLLIFKTQRDFRTYEDFRKKTSNYYPDTLPLSAGGRQYYYHIGMGDDISAVKFTLDEVDYLIFSCRDAFPK